MHKRGGYERVPLGSATPAQAPPAARSRAVTSNRDAAGDLNGGRTRRTSGACGALSEQPSHRRQAAAAAGASGCRPHGARRQRWRARGSPRGTARCKSEHRLEKGAEPRPGGCQHIQGGSRAAVAWAARRVRRSRRSHPPPPPPPAPATAINSEVPLTRCRRLWHSSRAFSVGRQGRLGGGGPAALAVLQRAC